MDIIFHYPPELLALLKEALPKLCKSKQDLLNYFQGAGVSRDALVPYQRLLSEKRNEFNKYHVTRDLLMMLNEKGEAGLGERRALLKRVTDTEDFSGCWENDRAAAIGLVAQIRAMVDVKDSFTRMKNDRDLEARQRRAAQDAALAAAEENKRVIRAVRDDFYALFGAKDAHKRGKDLERVLNALFAAYGVLVREAFTVKRTDSEGIVEQIDGLIELEGTLYLVELKWWNTAIGVAEIAPHLVRVFSRGGQARGIFISYSPYTEPAIAQCRDAIALGAIIVLCKLEEIVRILDSDADLPRVLKAKVQSVIADKQPLLAVAGA